MKENNNLQTADYNLFIFNTLLVNIGYQDIIQNYYALSSW